MDEALPIPGVKPLPGPRPVLTVVDAAGAPVLTAPAFGDVPVAAPVPLAPGPEPAPEPEPELAPDEPELPASWACRATSDTQESPSANGAT